MSNTEWIVEQACNHVTRWRLMESWEDLNTYRPPSEPQACKHAPVIDWGEWCLRCREIVPVTRTA